MPCILIVDDREENLYYLQALLTGHGWEVDTARHGAEALVKARRRRPDLVVSDLLMPVMDGFMLLRHWKADPQLQSVPFIVYTATYTEAEDERLALGLGADAFILKPAEPEEFLSRLREVQANTATARPAIPRTSKGDEKVLLEAYSEALIRKLEEKSLQLEESNRALQQDVAERRLAEEKLRESEATLRLLAETQIAILNALPAHVALVDAQGVIVSVNESWRRFAAANVLQSPSFGLGQNYLEICERAAGNCSEEAVIAADGLRRVLRGEAREFALEYPCHAPDEQRWFRLMVTPLHEDRRVGAVVMHLDTTERHRAVDLLRESEARFRELAETVHEVFWITDPAKTRMIYVSPAYEKIWGRTCASLYASPQTWLEAIHPDDRARIRQALEAKLARGEYNETYRILRSDGAVRWIHDRAFPVRSPTGEVLRVVGTAEDITTRWETEEQYRQSQKMEAFGQLAGGVAHDFNNILAVVMMQAQLSENEAGLPTEVREGLQIIRASVERGADLTRQLLLFSHKQVMQPRLLDLNEVVTSLSRMLQRIIEENVRLQLHLHPVPLFTSADAGMLDQVLMNLAVNARDAMPEGGRLTIETAEETIDLEAAHFHRGATPGRYACLSVSDTGCGMAPEVLPRIFEPFFTTKGPAKGTGLGLATLFGIVQQHHGWVSVTTEVGKGTTFKIFLPANEAGVAEIARAAQSTPRGGSEIILVVEDEADVRLLTCAVLERAGYRVLVAHDGIEARRIWQEQSETIDLLYTDIVMPGGVSGPELAAELQRNKPGLRVVFTSGYSADVPRGKFALNEGRNFVRKPCSPRDLMETVRRSLDE